MSENQETQSVRSKGSIQDLGLPDPILKAILGSPRRPSKQTLNVLFASAIALFLVGGDLNWTKWGHGDSSIAFAQESRSNREDPETSQLISQLETIAKTLSPFERRTGAYELLVDASANALVDYLQQTQESIPDLVQREFHELAVRRLTLLDPSQALSSIEKFSAQLREPLVQSVFEEWSMFSIQEATDRANQLEEPSRLFAITGILTAHNGLSDEEKRAIARDFGEERIFIELAAKALANEQIENPQKRWSQLTSEYGSDLEQLSVAQRAAVVQVALAMLKEEGVDALSRILGSFSAEENPAWLIQNLLERLYLEDPAVSVELAAHMMGTDREVLMQAFSEWSALDSWSAFEVAQRLDKEATAETDRLQRTVITGWAQSDPHKLLSALPKLPSSLQDWGRETALLEMSYTFPESVPAYLEDVENERQKRMIMDNLVNRWAQIDPLSAFEWASTVKDLPSEALGYSDVIFLEAVRRNPHSALHIALSVSTVEKELGPEAFVISSMTYWDVERAISMLESARNSYTRLHALSGIGLVMVRKGETERLIELAAEESEEDQFKYFEYFAWHWVGYAPKDMLSKFDSLPTEKVKKLCAGVLLEENQYEPFMTGEDMDRIRQFVSEEDQDLLQHTVE